MDQFPQTPTPLPELSVPRRHFTVVNIVIIFVTLAVLSAAVWMWWEFRQLENFVNDSALETADWQTYRNDAYGFELKYPASWKADDNCFFEDGGLVVFGMEEMMVLCYSDAPVDGPISLVIASLDTVDKNQRIDSVEKGLSNAKRSDIFVGDKPAIKVSGITKGNDFGWPKEGMDEIDVIFDNSKVLYHFIYLPIDNKDYKKEFDQILSTFKFIESANTGFIDKPDLGLVLGIYSYRNYILVLIDNYYFDYKKLPSYADLVNAGFFKESPPDTTYLSYLRYELVNDVRVEVCLRFKTDPSRPDEPQCKTYIPK